MARRIVALLAPGVSEPVVEIGPGTGELTAALLEAAPRVAAIELDPRMIEALRERFPAERLALIEGDVLAVPLAHAAAAAGASPAARVALAGNLPYNVSKPVTQKLVREHALVDRAVLMFQREVAERLTAAPGGRDYGPLGILTGTVFEIRRAFDLGPGAFRPPPAVRSSVTLWRPRSDPPGAAELGRLRAALAAGFARRRQTLRNNLRAALGDAARAEALLEQAGLDGAARAETVDPPGWRRLAALWTLV